VQGDEPMIHPDMISESVEPIILNEDILVTNLMAEIKTEEEFCDPNSIKVVFDDDKNALYFSREPIPSKGNIKVNRAFKQICVIPFRRNFLIEYLKLRPTPLEAIESIDMLRILENGMKVKMVKTNHETHAVDTKEDLIKVESMMDERA